MFLFGLNISTLYTQDAGPWSMTSNWWDGPVKILKIHV